MEPEDLRDALRELRNTTGLSQAKFAEAYGFAESTIAAYENARRIPPIDALEQYADRLGLSARSLATLKELRLQAKAGGSATLEQRVATLERQVGLLLAHPLSSIGSEPGSIGE